MQKKEYQLSYKKENLTGKINNNYFKLNYER